MSYWRFDLADLIDEAAQSAAKARKELDWLTKAIRRAQRDEPRAR